MGRTGLLGVLAALLLLAVQLPGRAHAQTRFYQCQHPVKTGVEVYDLRGMTPRGACPTALALFAWEYSSEARTRALYGCSRPRPEAAGYPYLRLPHFRGWALSLSGPEKQFTMTKGNRSFRVTGTDFPLNCS